MKKKIAIIHYRVGRTDGVSLEIEKRKQILESLGYGVRLISGPVQIGADFIIDELEFDQPDIVQLKENSFKYFNKSDLTPSDLMTGIERVSKRIEAAFLEYHKHENFKAVLIHNIFSHGRHLAAASAFSHLAQKLDIPFLSTNHDYYWEREEYADTTCVKIDKYLRDYVPFDNKNIIYISINSIARKKLLALRGIDSVVFPDIFDFEQPQWTGDDYNSDFRERFDIAPNDIMVLQATRIVARKGIELAVDFVKILSERINTLSGHVLYNGRKIDKNSRVVFVLAGYAEKSAAPYLTRLRKIIDKAGINARFIHESIAATRGQNGRDKIYSLWDAYVHCDLVSYPSLYEGWGNQFIEAVFARKPVVLFEYPVFTADIKKEGYQYISLGDKVQSEDRAFIPQEKIEQAVDASIKILMDDNTNSLLEQNALEGKKYHGYDVLKSFLEMQLGRNTQQHN